MNATSPNAAIAPRRLSDTQRSALENICRAAANKFEQDAAAWIAQKSASEAHYARPVEERQDPSGRTIDVTPLPDACSRLADQFELQAREARELAEMFSNNAEHEIVVLPTPYELEDDANRVTEYNIDFEAHEITACTARNQKTVYDL